MENNWDTRAKKYSKWIWNEHLFLNFKEILSSSADEQSFKYNIFWNYI